MCGDLDENGPSGSARPSFRRERGRARFTWQEPHSLRSAGVRTARRLAVLATALDKGGGTGGGSSAGKSATRLSQRTIQRASLGAGHPALKVASPGCSLEHLSREPPK